MNRKRIKSLLLTFLTILTTFGFSLALDQKTMMKTYCTVPPYMESTSKPNIILVMDYSGSMQFGAYTPTYAIYYYNRVVITYKGNSYLYNVNYDKTKTYYGYFKPEKYYKYSSTNGYWVVNTNCNIDPNNDYYRIGNSKNCISGNLLNYITTSRIDVALKALTGGKTRTCGDNQTCLIPRGGYRYMQDETSGCKFEIDPNKYWNNQTQYNKSNYDLKISITGNNKCKIKGISGAWLRIKVDPSEKVGVLQKNADIGNFALMVFSADGRYGEIRFGIHEYKIYGMDSLVQKIDNELPYHGTPTGEALYEAYDYIKQANSHSYESNSSYISKGTSKDPFYEDHLGKIIPCKRTAIILISDGEWNGSKDPINPAYEMHVNDLRSDLEGTQNADVYTLFTFSDSQQGKNAMESTAAAGTFIDLDNNNQPYDINIYDWSTDINFPRPNCNPNGTYKDNCKEWDKDGDGVPNAFFYASNGDELEEALNNIFISILKNEYAGGSVAVLGQRSKENSSTGVVLKGSVLGQALFYTEKYGVDWIGKVYGYWYYLADSSIREDTNQDNKLTTTVDKIVEFGLENNKRLVINRYNVDTSGKKGDLDIKLYDPDDLDYIFETGYTLLTDFNESNDSTEDDRRIFYAACNQGPDCMKEFRYENINDFLFERDEYTIPLLGLPAECFNMCNYWNGFGQSTNPVDVWNKFIQCLNEHNDYEKIVNYIRGRDYTGFRNRTIDGKVWKLGDIMYSSPQIVTYDNKSILIVGANDGMLHAFEIGKVSDEGLSGNDIIKINGDNIGKELWTFIPMNLLPYLRFLTDPDYCHLYYVDLTTSIYKTADNRIILIGGLRLGGGTGEHPKNNAPNGYNQPVNPPGWACPTSFWGFMEEQCNSCVKDFPGMSLFCRFFPSGPTDFSKCIGLSSYFALDITDPDNPQFLWEFTHPDLGFTYSGGTIIYKDNKTYIMFGSGPTSYKGDSNQKLKYFVIDFEGSNVNNPVILQPQTPINNAFSGRMTKFGYDYNNDDITDYVFVGYARRDGDMKNWKGGLLKIDVRDDNPENWTITKYFTDAQSPVTAKVEIGKCFDKDYLFFGTGRWMYKTDNSLSGQKNRLYGVPIVCDVQTGDCSPNVNVAHSSKDVCTDAGNNVIRSWYIELNNNDSGYLKERVITDPVLTGQNAVLFTTVEPINDPCKFGGRTRIWALNCATGGALTEQCQIYPIDIQKLKGTTLLQLSGGNIEQINLAEIPNATSNHKTTEWMTGTAPESGPTFVKPISPKAEKGQILLWIER